MNRSPGRAFVFVLLACVGLPDVDAQVRSRVLPIDEMAQKADVIGVATVRGSAYRLEERSGAICTDFTLSFSEVWKGEANSEFILVKAGGKIGEITSTLPGHEYQLRVGEEVVVFASPNTFGNHSAIGIRQGLYRVGQGPDHPLFRVSEFPQSTGKSSPLTLQALKDDVWRALGRPVESHPLAPRSSPAPPPKEMSSEADSNGNAAAPIPPAAASIPATQPASDFRGWSGLIVLLVLLVVGLGVMVTARKPVLKK